MLLIGQKPIHQMLMNQLYAFVGNFVKIGASYSKQFINQKKL
jgi:hypothetical protein